MQLHLSCKRDDSPFNTKVQCEHRLGWSWFSSLLHFLLSFCGFGLMVVLLVNATRISFLLALFSLVDSSCFGGTYCTSCALHSSWNADSLCFCFAVASIANLFLRPAISSLACRLLRLSSIRLTTCVRCNLFNLLYLNLSAADLHFVLSASRRSRVAMTESSG